MPRVHLEKFYVDVVTKDGSGCIGYAARLHGFGLAATLASTLRWPVDSGGAAVQRRTSRGTLPGIAQGALHWRCSALGLDGIWSSAPHTHAEAKILWLDGAGSVTWEVLAPRARVELRADDGDLIGWGYAERLTLTVNPWRLPIDSLRWGRFVSPEHSVAWIDWEHRTPRRWLLHDGIEIRGFNVDDAHLSWPGHALAFHETRVLRSGRLADTVFSRWRLIERVLPRRILALQETKWCSAGVLINDDGKETPGRVIHERVRFR